MRAALTQTPERVGAAFDTQLEAADTKIGFEGRELAIIFEALGTGLLMDRALEPDGPQPELLARTLRKLLAPEPGAP